MGIFDFLKYKTEIKKEYLKFEDISKWFDIKEKEIENKEKETIEQISKMLFDIIQKLHEKKEILENIDLKQKKIEDRIRFIVNENLEKYISYIDKLISNLQNLNKTRKEIKIKEFINKINLNFIVFNQKSELNFEKATFVIGQELEAVKESISLFFKDFNKIIDENKESMEFSDKVHLIKKKLSDINQSNSLKKESEENIMDYNKKIMNLEKENKEIEDEMNDIKKNPEYLEEIKEKQEKEIEKIMIKKEIDSIREMIDFKQLSGIFHSDNKKMIIINKYKDKFYENFEYNNGQDIINLLEEASIENQRILMKIEEIIKRKQEIEKKSEIIDLTKSFEMKLKANENQINADKNIIEEFNFEIEREERKILKYNENENEILEFIKKEMTKINIELIM